MAAALLRLRLRRAATLAPLIPASVSSSYSKPPYPLRAVTAGGGGLPDARRAQLSAPPVPPSMLRLYASEGCARPTPLRQPAHHHQATRRLHKVSVATPSVLLGSRRMQLSLPLVPTPTRHFSSKGNVMPPLRKLIDPQEIMRYLKMLGLAILWFMVSNWIHIWRLYVGRKDSHDGAIILWFFKKVMNDLREQSKIIDEAIATLEKADHLLEEGLDDEAFSVFAQGTDDLLKALAIYEKGLDDLVTVVGSWDELPLATQEHLRVLCKALDDLIKIKRQRANKLSATFKNKILLRMGSQGL